MGLLSIREALNHSNGFCTKHIDYQGLHVISDAYGELLEGRWDICLDKVACKAYLLEFGDFHSNLDYVMALFLLQNSWHLILSGSTLTTVCP